MIRWFKIFPGFCLDASHFENHVIIRKVQAQKNLPEYLRKYKVGCAHFSAIIKESISHIEDGRKFTDYVSHWLRDLSELDYVKKYIKYLPPICAIELENPLKRQLEAKKYLEKVIRRR
jgi:hypothetical protein